MRRYRIKLTGSGRSFTAREDETILEAALRQGISLPYGCRDGACGTCAVTVESGHLQYPGGVPPALGVASLQQGRALLCQATPVADLAITAQEIDSAANLPVKELPCRVDGKTLLSGNVVRLLLKPPPAERLQFLAGQYVDILHTDGRRRGFSLANAPHDDEFLELHIRYVEGGVFTDFVFKEMPDKAILRIAGPLGTFYLREDSPRPLLLVAGGTGFAPLKGILEHAFHTGIHRPMHLFWGGATPADLYLDGLPRGWARQHRNFRYTPVLAHPGEEKSWTGESGTVLDAVARHYPGLQDHDVYISGPPAMVEAAKAQFHAGGLAAENLFYDSFEFAPQRSAGAS